MIHSFVHTSLSFHPCIAEQTFQQCFCAEIGFSHTVATIAFLSKDTRVTDFAAPEMKAIFFTCAFPKNV